MKQLSLAEPRFVKKPKATRRQIFLAGMDRLASWTRLCALTELYCLEVPNFLLNISCCSSLAAVSWLRERRSTY